MFGQTIPLFQIIAVNKGHICGTLIYRAKPTDFGGTIDVTPPSLKLQPNEHKSFNLSFSSNRKGDFVERVDFVVKESLEVLSLHIKYVVRSMNREKPVGRRLFPLTMRRFFLSYRGCIICPTLHFDEDSLDFGTTAIGKFREMILLKWIERENGKVQWLTKVFENFAYTSVCVCCETF